MRNNNSTATSIRVVRSARRSERLGAIGTVGPPSGGRSRRLRDLALLLEKRRENDRSSYNNIWFDFFFFKATGNFENNI